MVDFPTSVLCLRKTWCPDQGPVCMVISWILQKHNDDLNKFIYFFACLPVRHLGIPSKTDYGVGAARCLPFSQWRVVGGSRTPAWCSVCLNTGRRPAGRRALGWHLHRSRHSTPAPNTPATGASYTACGGENHKSETDLNTRLPCLRQNFKRLDVTSCLKLMSFNASVETKDMLNFLQHSNISGITFSEPIIIGKQTPDRVIYGYGSLWSNNDRLAARYSARYRRKSIIWHKNGDLKIMLFLLLKHK